MPRIAKARVYSNSRHWVTDNRKNRAWDAGLGVAESSAVNRTLFLIVLASVWLYPVKSALAGEHRMVISRSVDNDWSPHLRVAKLLHNFDWDDFSNEKQAIQDQLTHFKLPQEELEELRNRIRKTGEKQESLLVELEDLYQRTKNTASTMELKNIEILKEKVKGRKALVLGLHIQVTKKYQEQFLGPEEELGKEYPAMFPEGMFPKKLLWSPPPQKFIEPE